MGWVLPKALRASLGIRSEVWEGRREEMQSALYIQDVHKAMGVQSHI